jgi:hypothetical protein
MPATKDGFAFTDNDAAIVTYIHECRFATVDHLAALTGREAKDVHRRLFRLEKRKYLHQLKRRSKKTVYSLHKEGISVLVERGVAPRELLEWRIRHENVKDLFIDHALLISDVYTFLTVASRTSQLKLAEWRQDRGLFDSAPVVVDGERDMLPIRPDAFFVLEDTGRPSGANRLAFFLEADRSTTTHRRFKDKALAYWSYLQNGLQKKKLGVPGFRVATVTLNAERAKGLCDAVQEVLPREAGKFFLFAPVDVASFDTPAMIFDPVFISPRDREQKYALFAPADRPLTATGAAT